jgi:hypothetical protein
VDPPDGGGDRRVVAAEAAGDVRLVAEQGPSHLGPAQGAGGRQLLLTLT